MPSAPPRTSRLQWLGFAGLFGGIAAAVALAASFVAPAPVCACSPTAPPLPESPVVGVVVDVTSAGLGNVERFNVRLPDGTTIVLQMGTLENAAEFPPAHLAEHQASSSPIRAYYRIGTSGDPEVYRLEDAAPP